MIKSYDTLPKDVLVHDIMGFGIWEAKGKIQYLLTNFHCMKICRNSNRHG